MTQKKVKKRSKPPKQPRSAGPGFGRGPPRIYPWLMIHIPVIDARTQIGCHSVAQSRARKHRGEVLRYLFIVNQETTSLNAPTSRSTLWELLVHIITGTMVFVAIALAAVGLNFLVRWLSEGGVSQFIIWGLEFAEYFLFVVDLILFTVFVARTAIRTLKKL